MFKDGAITDVAALRTKLAAAIGHDRFELWLTPDSHLRCLGDENAPRLRFELESGFLCEQARRNLGADLTAAARQLWHTAATVEFGVVESFNRPKVSAEEPSTEIAVARKTSPIPAGEAQRATASRPTERSQPSGCTPPGPTRLFTNLVVGKSNELATKAAQQIAAGRQVGGPLVLWGPAGSGKTHLLSAIRAAFRARFPRSRVLSLTAEQFVSHYVEALRGGGLPSFRSKHRGANLLLVDDLHFMAGKKATLEELHHTIDRVTEAGGQVVLTSIVEPGEIGHLGPELLSRLRAGLLCEITAADFAMRVQLARRQCEAFSLPIAEPELRTLAAGVTAGARELIGAVQRLRAKYELLQEPLDINTVQQVTGEIQRQTTRPVAIQEIQQAVCDFYGVEARALRSSSRAKSIAGPRMLAMWLARKYTQAGWREIGEAFGGRSHSTVIAAHRRIEQQRQAAEATNGQLDQAVSRIEAALRSA